MKAKYQDALCIPDVQHDVILDVLTERERQETLKAQGKFPHTCSDPIPNAERFAILGEECGEVGHEVNEESATGWKYLAAHLGNLTLPTNMPAHRRRYYLQQIRKELIQVMAVSLAWCEGLAKELDNLRAHADQEIRQLQNDIAADESVDKD